MILRSSMLSVLMFSSLALGADPPGASTSGVMASLLRIEAATARGAGGDLRAKYVEEARQKPGDPFPRIALAWLTIPSDESWNELKSTAFLYPNNPWVHYGMARVYAQWKMREQAEKEVALALKIDPAFYPAMVVSGDLARVKEDWPTAQKHYGAALAIADDPLARAGLGLTLLGEGTAEAAKVELKKAVALFPEHPLALAALVKLQAEAKDPEAIALAQTLAEIRPKDREAWRMLADMRFEQGDKAQAARDYEHLLGLGNMEVPVLERLGAIYREAGDAEGEARVLGHWAALDAKNGKPSLRLGELRFASKDFDGAAAHLKEALKREPALTSALLLSGQVQEEQKRPWGALEEYRVAIAAEPSSQVAQASVQRLEGEFKLPKKKLKGNVNAVYASVKASLDKWSRERAGGKASGTLRLRVRIKGQVAEGVDVMEDTLRDPVLVGHVYFLLRDATYAEKKGEPVFEFDLGKPSK